MTNRDKDWIRLDSHGADGGHKGDHEDTLLPQHGEDAESGPLHTSSTSAYFTTARPEPVRQKAEDTSQNTWASAAPGPVMSELARARQEAFEKREAEILKKRAMAAAKRRQVTQRVALSAGMLVACVAGFTVPYLMTKHSDMLQQLSRPEQAATAPEIEVSAQNGGEAQGSSSHFLKGTQQAYVAASPEQVEALVELARPETANESAASTSVAGDDAPADPAAVTEPIRKLPPPPRLQDVQTAAAAVPRAQASQADGQTNSSTIVAAQPPRQQAARARAERDITGQARRVYVDPATMPADPGGNQNLTRSSRTSGNGLASGEWVELPAAQAAQAAGEDSTKKVAAIAPSARTADQAAAKPEQQAARQQPAEAEVPAKAANEPKRGLLEHGDRLLMLGDVVAARQIYQHALSKGSKGAEARIASTYDPRMYSQLGVRGLKPDVAMALKWYERALAAGDAKAEQAIRNLKAQANAP